MMGAFRVIAVVCLVTGSGVCSAQPMSLIGGEVRIGEDHLLLDSSESQGFRESPTRWFKLFTLENVNTHESYLQISWEVREPIFGFLDLVLDDTAGTTWYRQDPGGHRDSWFTYDGFDVPVDPVHFKESVVGAHRIDFGGGYWAQGRFGVFSKPVPEPSGVVCLGSA